MLGWVRCDSQPPPPSADIARPICRALLQPLPFILPQVVAVPGFSAVQIVATDVETPRPLDLSLHVMSKESREPKPPLSE